MADFHEQFCFTIDMPTADELAWLQSLVDDETKMWEYGDDVADEHAGFELEITDIGVFVFSDVSGTPENVGRFCQDFLARFRPDDFLSFEWAATCSRVMPEGFGGGAAFITADEAKYTWTGQWVYEQTEAFQQAKETPR